MIYNVKWIIWTMCWSRCHLSNTNQTSIVVVCSNSWTQWQKIISNWRSSTRSCRDSVSWWRMRRMMWKRTLRDYRKTMRDGTCQLLVLVTTAVITDWHGLTCHSANCCVPQWTGWWNALLTHAAYRRRTTTVQWHDMTAMLCCTITVKVSLSLCTCDNVLMKYTHVHSCVLYTCLSFVSMRVSCLSVMSFSLCPSLMYCFVLLWVILLFYLFVSLILCVIWI